MKDFYIPVKQLNKGLLLVSELACKWKMSFNLDKSKQGQQVVFSSKQSKSQHAQLPFNNVPVDRFSLQKHIGVLLV